MRALLATAVVLAAWACGGSSTVAPLVFDATPAQVVTSASGALQVLVHEQQGQPVARGVSAVLLEVRGDAGVDTVAVTPWMPVMGHGSAVVPQVAATDAGFVVTNLYLAMPGTWELRCDLSGQVTDHATLTFQLQ